MTFEYDMTQGKVLLFPRVQKVHRDSVFLVLIMPTHLENFNLDVTWSYCSILDCIWLLSLREAAFFLWGNGRGMVVGEKEDGRGESRKGRDGKLQLGCNILKNNDYDDMVVEVMMMRRMMIKDQL